MFVNEAINWLLYKKCTDKEIRIIRPAASDKFVLLEDGRMIPVEPGGMVEIALNELGAKIVEAEIPSGEMENQST
jgi:hypothetical protein